MGSVNKVILVGNLGRDPELRYTPGGQAVANFTMATTRNWTDKDGKKQERTEWHRIVAWGKLGETCGQYLSKGRQVYIEGRLETREWNDKDGHKRQTTEINALEIVFLGSGGGGGVKGEGRGTGAAPSEPMGDAEGGAPIPDDDIPF